MNAICKFLSLAFLVCLAIGCADEGLKPVTGTVLLDGQPAGGVSVIFVPVEGGRTNSIAKTDATGHFELRYTSRNSGALPGTYKVLIKKEQNDTGVELIPARYSSGRSETRAEVTEGGENTFHFEIESK